MPLPCCASRFFKFLTGFCSQVPSSRPRVVIVATMPSGPALPARMNALVPCGQVLLNMQWGRILALGSEGHKRAMTKFKAPNKILKTRAFCYGTIDMLKPAPCVQTAFKNETSMRCLLTKVVDGKRRFFHLSNEQAAALVTFPRGYKFAGTDMDVGQQIGNCIPPKFACALFMHVRRTGMDGSPPAA